MKLARTRHDPRGNDFVSALETLFTQGVWNGPSIQSWPKVLGCVILPAGAVARSRNIGQTFLVNSVVNNTLGYLFTTLNSQTQLL